MLPARRTPLETLGRAAPPGAPQRALGGGAPGAAKPTTHQVSSPQPLSGLRRPQPRAPHRRAGGSGSRRSDAELPRGVGPVPSAPEPKFHSGGYLDRGVTRRRYIVEGGKQKSRGNLAAHSGPQTKGGAAPMARNPIIRELTPITLGASSLTYLL